MQNRLHNIAYWINFYKSPYWVLMLDVKILLNYRYFSGMRVWGWTWDLTHFGEAPFNTGCPAIANINAGQIAQLCQGGAHLGALEVGLQDNLGRNVDYHDGVDDGHGRHDRQHHGAEHGQAESLLARLRRVLKLGHRIGWSTWQFFSIVSA